MFKITCTVQGVALRLEIPEKRVFVPNLPCLSLASQIHVSPGDVVCDVGTGSGFFGILCAKLGAKRVYGVDMNPDAVRNARKNARLNGVADRCVFLRGSLLEPLQHLAGKVDLIVDCVPQLPKSSPFLREPAFLAAPRMARYLVAGPERGDMGIQIVRGATTLLKPDGRILTFVRNDVKSRRLWKVMREEGFQISRSALTRIPKWGVRCNMRYWFARHPGGSSRSVLFRHLSDDSTAEATSAVTVTQASRGPARPLEEKSWRIGLRWDRLPAYWRKK